MGFWAVFAIGVYVFVWAKAGPRDSGVDSDSALRFTRFLYLAAFIAGLFACADFYFQFPAPAGFEEQFVWLDEGVVRRAQGLFYEASTLGNFCACFLVMTIVAWLRPHRESPCSRPLLIAGGLVFAGALILSYSRASIIAVVVACGTPRLSAARPHWTSTCGRGDFADRCRSRDSPVRGALIRPELLDSYQHFVSGYFRDARTAC